MAERFDDIVIGAGIVGLAHARALATRGRRVAVLERGPRAESASVRNFGMIWPIGQPHGLRREVALESRAIWLDVLRDAGLWHDACGSLHVAHEDDEAAVLAEFAARERAEGGACELLAPDAVLDRAPGVERKALRAGVYSPTEICVDPREVVAALPGWLARRHGVAFAFGTAVSAIEGDAVRAGDRVLRAARTWLCPGAELAALLPGLLGQAGLVACKLQMMRSAPLPGFRLGPMLAGGLTLRHYACFEGLPSLASVRARVTRDEPDFDRFGIHVMVSQNGRGELVIGDSHEYGDAIEPFDKSEIDALVLGYLARIFSPPALRIAARWNGVYAKHPREPWLVVRPAAPLTVVTGLGGAGMTLSFGLAERIVAAELGAP